MQVERRQRAALIAEGRSKGSGTTVRGKGERVPSSGKGERGGVGCAEEGKRGHPERPKVGGRDREAERVSNERRCLF